MAPFAPRPAQRPGFSAQAFDELADGEVRALAEALREEYRTEAFYAQALERFGPNRRFENLRAAEQRHIAALRSLYERYGVRPPAPEGLEPDVPATLAAALDAAAAFEACEGPLYDRLLESVEHEDIRAVFKRLQEVSLERHLPALQRGGARP
jgi:rubrerythrin